MDLWLWLHCRPTFAIVCWTSSTRHLKLNTAINKLIIFLSRMCSSIPHPPQGVRVFSNHYSSQLCCSHYSAFSSFSTINSQTDCQLTQRSLVSNRIPNFWHPIQLLLIVPSHSVSNLWNTMKPLSSLTTPIYKIPKWSLVLFGSV